MSDATDQLGNYNGTATNVNFNVAGKFGNAGEFNGSSSKINTGVTNAFDLQTFSVSAWINLNNSSSQTFVCNFGTDSQPNGLGWTFRINGSGQLDFGDAYGAGISGSVLATNTWIHVVSVCNVSTGEQTIYLNGQQDATRNNYSGIAYVAGGFPAGSRRLTIGELGGNNSQLLNGKIDQIRIYDSALSAANVTALYNEVQCIPTIVPTDYFNTVTWTSTGGNTDISVTGVGFQPDLVWAKARTDAYSHTLYDSVRGAGVNHKLMTNTTNSESSLISDSQNYGYLGSFDIDGFTGKAGTTDNSYFNYNTGKDYVAWNWKAGGAKVTNPQGNTASQISANPDAGFSIVTHTSSMLSSQTFGHGLNSTPKIVISRVRNIADSWWVFMPDVIGNTNVLELNAAAAARSVGLTFNANDTTFNIQWTSTSYDFLHYCFAEVDGYSKIGSYVGTGASGTPNIVTGFRPAFLMVKRIDSVDNWLVFDNKRNTTNPTNLALIPNSNAVESVGNLGNGFNFLSNGFQIVSTDTGINANGGSYIFMAIA
jgi:hypothetical protein